MFCGRFQPCGREGPIRIFECLGHSHLGAEGPLDGPELGAPKSKAVVPAEPTEPIEMDPVPHRAGDFDHYELHPARGAIAQAHVEWRWEEWNPHDLPGDLTQHSLQKKRVTQKEFADGTLDTVEDEWGGTPRPDHDERGRVKKITRKTKGACRGMIWFFLKESSGVPAPPRKQMRAKGLPSAETDVDRLLRR